MQQDPYLLQAIAQQLGTETNDPQASDREIINQCWWAIATVEAQAGFSKAVSKLNFKFWSRQTEISGAGILPDDAARTTGHQRLLSKRMV